MQLRTVISTTQSVAIRRKNLIECPSCRQKLTEIIEVRGHIWQQIKCRRCGLFIDIIADEN